MRGLALVLVALGCGGASTKPAQPAPTSPAPTELSSVATEEPPPPAGLSLSGLEPERGDAEGGTYVRIRGQGFINAGPRNTRVYFGSHQGTVVRFASDGELIVEAPGGTGQTVDVLVTFDPGGELKLPQAFTFVDKN